MKITITIEDSTPWYAPFRSPQEYWKWDLQRQQYEEIIHHLREQRYLEELEKRGGWFKDIADVWNAQRKSRLNTNPQ